MKRTEINKNKWYFNADEHLGNDACIVSGERIIELLEYFDDHQNTTASDDNRDYLIREVDLAIEICELGEDDVLEPHLAGCWYRTGQAKNFHGGRDIVTDSKQHISQRTLDAASMNGPFQQYQQAFDAALADIEEIEKEKDNYGF
jgi:hypothetical protein